MKMKILHLTVYLLIRDHENEQDQRDILPVQLRSGLTRTISHYFYRIK